MATIIFTGQFIASKVGLDGLAPTVNVDRVTRADGTHLAFVTGGAINVTYGRNGLYGYRLTGADLTLYDYVVTFITPDATVDQKEVSAVWTLWSLSWHDILTSALTAVGSIGKLLVDMIDAPISGAAIPGDAMTLTAGERATLYAGIWSNVTRTLTDYGTLVADITTAISAILCNVWNCARRTLTMPITLLKSMLRGEKLELYRGDTLDLDIVGLGDLTTATELWFTVKKQLSDPDATAEIQISLTAGLEAIAGAIAATPANGSITITDLAAGNITIALTAEEMAKLDVDFVGYWDVQKAVGVIVSTLTRGNAQVLGDATRSVA